MEDVELGDWIKHDGGECPVARNSRVEVRFRDKSESTDRRTAGWWADGGDCWVAENSDADIIAYRVIPS